MRLRPHLALAYWLVMPVLPDSASLPDLASPLPIPASLFHIASSTLAPALPALVAREFRLLRPRAPLPAIAAEFYPFVGLNTTIRLREGGLRVRISDLLEAAPEPVLGAVLHILIAKLYRKPISTERAALYRRWTNSTIVREQSERVRKLRGRKRIGSAQGRRWDLQEVFASLNARFFHGLLDQPSLSWSKHDARRLLGHYDAAHNAIVISRAFDRPETPRYAVEYLLYHEMLHLKHPVTTHRGRRCVHSRAFQEEEARFPQLEAARTWLQQLARG